MPGCASKMNAPVDSNVHNDRNGPIQSRGKSEWILLDFGNVICGYDYDPFIRFLVANGPCSQGQVARRMFGVDGLLSAYETGAIGTKEFVELTQRSIAPAASLQQVETRFSRIFEEWPSAIAALPLLARRYRLALLSDTNELHFETMIAPIITPHMELVILSYKEGRMKPDVALFRTFLDRAEARPESCLFFDDAKPNVEAARGIGIPSHRVSGPLGLKDACIRLGLIGSTD